MKILLSPAKKMRFDPMPGDVPFFAPEAEALRKEMSAWTFEEAKARYKASESLVREAMRWNEEEVPMGRALFAYDGIAYRYLSPDRLAEESLDYLERHLLILSGLYGALRPFDGISAYRLEMQTRGPFFGEKDLYAFWRKRLPPSLAEETVWNLASEEYAKLLRPFFPPERFIDFVFAEKEGGRLIEKGVYAKMARGAMARYLAERKAETLEEAKAFSFFSYAYSPRDSRENRLVFVKTKEQEKGTNHYDPDW